MTMSCHKRSPLILSVPVKSRISIAKQVPNSIAVPKITNFFRKWLTLRDSHKGSCFEMFLKLFRHAAFMG